MEVTGIGITLMKLNGENWPIWKFQTIVIMKSRGYYELLIGQCKKPSENAEVAKWVKHDAKAQELIIVTRMGEEAITHILSCESACEMWKKLTSVYDKESDVSVHLLQQRFILMEFGNNNVSTLISHLDEIRNKPKQANVSEKMILTKIFMSLPDRYKYFRSAWESVPTANQSLSELTSRLSIEEEIMTNAEENTALASSSQKERQQKVSYSRSRGEERNGGNSTCHFCHKPGHFAIEERNSSVRIVRNKDMIYQHAGLIRTKNKEDRDLSVTETMKHQQQTPS